MSEPSFLALNGSCTLWPKANALTGKGKQRRSPASTLTQFPLRFRHLDNIQSQLCSQSIARINAIKESDDDDDDDDDCVQNTTKTLTRRPTDQRRKCPIAPDPALIGTEALLQDDRRLDEIQGTSFVRQLGFPFQLNSGDERTFGYSGASRTIQESGLEGGASPLSFPALSFPPSLTLSLPPSTWFDACCWNYSKWWKDFYLFLSSSLLSFSRWFESKKQFL